MSNIAYVIAMDMREETQAASGVGPANTVAKPMAVPGRVYFGALVVGVAIAGLVALGVLGADEAPKTTDFRFTRGLELAPGEDARLRGALTALAAQPDRLVRITGHTGQQGDAAANLDLSNERAAFVASIAQAMGLPSDRILSVAGVGGGDPLPKPNGTTEREWERSLSRVTVTDQAAP